MAEPEWVVKKLLESGQLGIASQHRRMGKARVLEGIFFQPSKRVQVVSFDSHLKMKLRTAGDTRVYDACYKVSSFDLIIDLE